MEFTIHPQTQWNTKENVTGPGIWNKFLSALDKQESNITLWYIVSMIAQGVLFLPVPAAMIFYFNASLLLLPVTLGLFFANIIAGMGGAGIRVLLSLFMASTIIHLAVVAFYML